MLISFFENENQFHEMFFLKLISRKKMVMKYITGEYILVFLNQAIRVVGKLFSLDLHSEPKANSNV